MDDNQQLNDSSSTENISHIVQIANLCLTGVFLFFFAYQWFKLSHRATSLEHIKSYPCIRVVLACIYIFLSFFLIVYLLITNIQSGQFKFLTILREGGGEFINSIILCFSLRVLWLQLKKQQPYTKLHLIYATYLSIISLARFIYAIIIIVNDTRGDYIVNLVLSTALCIDSIAMLGYWWKKRRELPQFSYMSLEDLKKNISFHNSSQRADTMHHHHLSTQSNHQYIIPTVLVEKSNFKVILEIFVDNSILKQMVDETRAHEKSQKHLQIISQQLFTLSEIKEIYLKCNIFELKTSLNFHQNINLGEFYQSLQTFLEEVFAEKKHYIPEILHLFDIPKNIVHEYEKKSLIKNMSQIMNNNSAFLSINIYKQLWVQDHYIFYMDVRTIDGKDYSLLYRRYSDFERFYEKLKSVLSQYLHKRYELPSLPKKQFFHWNDDLKRINQRRKQLEIFCQQIGNDYFLMNECPQTKELICEFLQLKKVFVISTNEKINYQFYSGLQVKKGNINKKLIENETVTFYEFKLYRKGMLQHTIMKRFNQFVNLHSAINRWMENIQIKYRFIELPERHLYKSQQHRHQKLKRYLQMLITINGIHRVHSVNSFFQILSDLNDGNEESYLSIIKRNQSGSKILEEEKQMDLKEGEKVSLSMNSSYISNHRMSKLIDDLGS